MFWSGVYLQSIRDNYIHSEHYKRAKFHAIRVENSENDREIQTILIYFIIMQFVSNSILTLVKHYILYV